MGKACNWIPRERNWGYAENTATKASETVSCMQGFTLVMGEQHRRWN
jgi:hypothetical protein